MNVEDGRGALGLLLRLKARGWMRALQRRLSSVSGILFAVIGALVLSVWFGSIYLRRELVGSLGLELDADLVEPMTRLVLLGMVVLSLTGALAHRGLYLPPGELERLFSAPLTRAALIRYRMRVHFARSLPFGLISAIIFAPRLPVPGFATVGLVVSLLTLTILGQGLAIALGGAETRLGSLLQKLPVAPLRIVVGIAFWFLFMGMFFADELTASLPMLSGGSLDERLGELLSTRGFELLSLPLSPWSRMITAASWPGFLAWLGACLVLGQLLLVGVSSLPVDFRTLSISTSADVARRLSRMRSGRNMISGGKVSRLTLGWYVPWIFGRGPLGAIAWRQSCSIVRKSKGTLLFFAFVMGILTLCSMAMDFNGAENVGFGPSSWEGALLLAMLGTIYLGMGLRFDFRSELDLMEAMKAWPLPGWRVFLGVVLPEVALVSTLVVVALLLRAAFLGAFSPGLLAVLLCVPLLSYLWTALDNAVYLLAPVRFTPEQGSSMHFAGRAVVLVVVRMVALTAVSFLLAGSFIGVLQLGQPLGHGWAVTLAVIASLAVTTLLAVSLAAFGGWAFMRFDVSRQQLEAS